MPLGSDIIVAGAEEEEHLKLLEEVLERLSRYLTINKGKCAFFQKEVIYCGYRVDGEGLHKTAEKVQSVMEAPQPSNVSQLRAFLGMVNYYHRFLPNLSTTLTPLHHLLKKHIKWAWSPECEAAFNKVKQLMASDTVLTQFNPGLPLVLSCDASPYGLGAVLSHTMPDGGGTTSGIHVKNPDTGGMQLCPNRQGGIGCYLGSEEIPPVFVWPAFHTDHRPSAINGTLQP